MSLILEAKMEVDSEIIATLGLGNAASQKVSTIKDGSPASVCPL